MESRLALERLGCGSVPVVRLGLPDGAVASQMDVLTDALVALLGPDDLCATPWRSDGHPDHDATGSATLSAARTTHTPVLEYLVWAWHWATPGNESVPWGRCRRLDLDRREAARKRWAAYAFTSQIRPSDAEERQGPLLSDSVLRRFWRPFEVLIEGER
jgi:LmbE family N-acetylglucosaminyl deacetylase